MIEPSQLQFFPLSEQNVTEVMDRLPQLPSRPQEALVLQRRETQSESLKVWAEQQAVFECWHLFYGNAFVCLLMHVFAFM